MALVCKSPARPLVIKIQKQAVRQESYTHLVPLHDSSEYTFTNLMSVINISSFSNTKYLVTMTESVNGKGKVGEIVAEACVISAMS